VNREISGFHHDDQGDWIAELSCGHQQHVHHRPPFQVRPWVVDAESRRSRVGSSLSCPLCDRAELPKGLGRARTTPMWDEHTMPEGLRRTHRLARGTWGLIKVDSGQLRFVFKGDPIINVVVDDKGVQAIPPELEHFVQPLGRVRFSIEFFAVAGRDAEVFVDEPNEVSLTSEGPVSGAMTGESERPPDARPLI
jgi:tellurite methyltransferase